MRTPYFFVPLLSPAYRRGRTLLRRVSYRGDAVWCAVCQQGFGGWIGRQAVGCCPNCGSATRQKLAALHIARQFASGTATIRVLIFAPDEGLTARLRRMPGFHVTTADVSAPDVDHHWDITAIDAPDAAFDLVLCSHVLEHVPDDRAALGELRRILSPQGTAIIQVPYARDTPTTDEDFSEMRPAERVRRFGQSDHCRVYGRDLVDRMTDAGFAVEVLTPVATMTEAERARLGVWNDVLFICTPGDARQTDRRADA